MIYENLGMRFIRLERAHLELVRYWRNHPSITQFMENNVPITYENQLKWFEKVDTPDNLFFVAEYNNQSIGLISGKGFNEQRTMGEGGIFIWEQTLLNTLIPIKLAIALLDLSFVYCNFDHAYAHILKTNKRAIQFNKLLGYQLEPNQENLSNQLYKLTKKMYLRKRPMLLRGLKSLHIEPKLIFSEEDIISGYKQHFERHFLAEMVPLEFPKLIVI